MNDALGGGLVQLAHRQDELGPELVGRLLRSGDHALAVGLDRPLGGTVAQATLLGLAEVLLGTFRVRHRLSLGIRSLTLWTSQKNNFSGWLTRRQDRPEPRGAPMPG